MDCRDEDGSRELVQTLLPRKGDEALQTAFFNPVAKAYSSACPAPFLLFLSPASFPASTSWMHVRYLTIFKKLLNARRLPEKRRKSSIRKDQVWLRATRGTDGDHHTEAQVDQRRYSLLSLRCTLTLNLSFTIYCLDDHGQVISLGFHISHL